MKLVVVLLIVILGVSLSIEADFFDNFVHKITFEVSKASSKFQKKVYEKTQIVVIDESEKVLLEVKSFKWRFARLWNKFCTKNREFSYCKFMDDVVKTSRNGIQKMSNMTELFSVERIKKETFNAYNEEYNKLIKEKLERYRKLVTQKKLGCFFTQLRKLLENNVQDVQAASEKTRSESLLEFTERMRAYVEEVLLIKKQLSDGYRKCVKTKEVRHCLDVHAKVRWNFL